jgi:hypothetical protein
MLVSLEGYDDNSIEGWSIKKAVKAVAAPVKAIAKPIVKASPTVKKITASAKKITAPVSKITKASGTKITQATGIKKIINAVPALATPVNIVKSIKTKSLTPLKTQAKDTVKMVGIAQKVATMNPSAINMQTLSDKVSVAKITDKAVSKVQSNPNIRTVINKKAFVDAGLNPEQADKVVNAPPIEQAKVIESMTPQQQNVIEKSVTTQENEAAVKIADNEIKKNPPQKMTKEQIDAFNESQEKGEPLDLSLKKAKSEKPVIIKTESAGDEYYKQGLLHGEDTILKLLATKIFAQNMYNKVDLLTYDHVQDIIKAYIYATNKLSEEKKQSVYYNGTTEAERQKFFGNIFVRIVYLYMKGISTEEEAKKQGYDYDLRDRIWTTLAQLKKFAEADNTDSFLKYWKPYKTEAAKDVPSTPITASLMNPKMLAIGGAAIGIMFLLPKLSKGRK